MIFRCIFSAAIALLLTVGLSAAEQWSGSVAGTARVIDGDTTTARADGRNRRLRKEAEWLFERQDVAVRLGCAQVPSQNDRRHACVLPDH